MGTETGNAEQQPPEHVVTLSGDCGLKNIRALSDAMLAAIGTNERVVVDCTGISWADVTTAQLLLAAQRYAAGQGREVVVRAPLAPALSTLVESCGLAGTIRMAGDETPPGGGQAQENRQ